MSSRAKQNVRTYNIIQNMKHINSDDKTILNYISLLTAILDPEPSKDLRKYLLPEMFDKEESKARMKEIDEIRAKGEYTKYQTKYQTRTIKIKRKYNNLKNNQKMKITDKDGNEKIYNSMKDLAYAIGINYNTLKWHLKKNNDEGKTKLEYKGLIIEKII